MIKLLFIAPCTVQSSNRNFLEFRPSNIPSPATLTAMGMACNISSILPKTLITSSFQLLEQNPKPSISKTSTTIPRADRVTSFRSSSRSNISPLYCKIPNGSRLVVRAAVDGDYSSKRSSSSEPRETIMLPGCDYNHWLIVMEFPKDPAPTREQMIDTYLNTLATVLGRFALFLHFFWYYRLFIYYFKKITKALR